MFTSNLGSNFFLPPGLGNCVGWWRADRGFSTSTSSGQGWLDQSGHGNNVTWISAPSQNASDSGYNNQSTLSFSGSSHGTFASLFPNYPMTVIIIGEIDSGGESVFFADSGNGVGMFYSSGYFIYAGSSVTSGNTTQNTAQVFAGLYNNTSSKFWINTSSSPVGTGTTGNSNPATTEGLGAQGSSTTWIMTGKIAEIIVYNIGLSANQVSQAFSYAGQRYGAAWL